MAVIERHRIRRDKRPHVPLDFRDHIRRPRRGLTLRHQHPRRVVHLVRPWQAHIVVEAPDARVDERDKGTEPLTHAELERPAVVHVPQEEVGVFQVEADFDTRPVAARLERRAARKFWERRLQAAKKLLQEAVWIAIQPFPHAHALVELVRELEIDVEA